MNWIPFQERLHLIVLNPLGLAETDYQEKILACRLAKRSTESTGKQSKLVDAAEAFPEVKDICVTVKESYADVTVII